MVKQHRIWAPILLCLLCLDVVATPKTEALKLAPGAYSGKKSAPAHPRITSNLARLLERTPALVSQRASRRLARIEVVVQTDPARTQAIVESISELGAVVSRSHRDRLLISATSSTLGQIADLPGVVRVQTPAYARPHRVTSEGLAAIDAGLLHNAGVRGQGVKVAIWDTGFAGYRQRQAEGELPADIATFNPTGKDFEGGDSHGTAVAEIVHDIAPDAELMFVKTDTSLDVEAGAAFIATRGANVVNFSVGFPNQVGPRNGRSPVTSFLDSFVAQNDILFTVSAGNEGLNSWHGNALDSDGDGFLQIGDGGNQVLSFQVLAADRPATIIITVDWGDWGVDPENPRSDIDYDVLVWCPGTAVLDQSTACARSEDAQSGYPGQSPYEIIALRNPIPGEYTLAVAKFSRGQDASYLHIQVVGTGGQSLPMSPRTDTHTLSIPGDGRNLLTVGAYDPFSCPSAENCPIRDYSSTGPTQDGRIKPDVVAPDDVRTVGLDRFAGTSASAPHAAGLGALLKSQNAARNGEQLKYLIIATAGDSALPTLPGKDIISGAGQIGAQDAALRPSISTVDGLWWNPAQNGHGIFMDVRNERLLLAWFVYDASGDPYWLLGVATQQGAGRYTGTLNSFRGPGLSAPLASIFDASNSSVQAIFGGTFDVRFTGVSSADVSLRLAGDELLGTRNFDLSVTRQLFGPLADDVQQLPYADALGGLWNSANQGGHGFFVAIQSNVVAVCWYTYDSAGNPAWYLIAGRISEDTVTAQSFSFSGPGLVPNVSLANLFDGAGSTVLGNPDGSVAISLVDADTAVLNLTNVGGITDSIQIERVNF